MGIGINKLVNTSKNTIKRITKTSKSTAGYYVNGVKSGWQYGKRLSEIKKAGPLKKFALKMSGIFKKVKPRGEDLPYILGGAGLFSPIPFGSVIFFGIGKTINYVRKFNLKNLINKFHK